MVSLSLQLTKGRSHRFPLLILKARIMTTVIPCQESTSGRGEECEQATPTKRKRIFDFKMWNKRHVAFKLLYLGWDYDGLAKQDTTDQTIEAKLFDALMTTKLIEDPLKSNYSRCGRTDKGVSAFGQVVTIDVRTALLEGDGVIVPEGSKAVERKGDKTEELQFLNMLNRTLPQEIRVTGWAPVPPQFNARFNAMRRIYKYYFPIGSMDIEFMREGAKKFIGHHDFRNFCKYSTADIAAKTIRFDRTIVDITVEPAHESCSSSSDPYSQLFVCTVTGFAFLRHQIRCMMSILFLIAHRLEEPDIIDYMLDVNKCPGKPQYGMAADFPLVLHDCQFEDIKWQFPDATFMNAISQLQKMWTYHVTQATIIRSMLDSLHDDIDQTNDDTSSPIDYVSPLIKTDHVLGRKYKQIRKRPTSDTYEERCEAYHDAKKRKMEDENIHD